jgi:hypothetical protein
MGKNHPMVERSRPLFATSAGLDSKVGSRPFDHIAKPDLLVRNKSGQAQPMRRIFTLV